MSREEALKGFVVLTAPRSGSTWFLDLLRLATDARVFAELFIPGRKPRSERLMTAGTAAYLDTHFRDVPLFCELDRTWWPIRPLRTFRYLNRIMGQRGTVGFKLMYPNLLNYPEIWAYLVRHHAAGGASRSPEPSRCLPVITVTLLDPGGPQPGGRTRSTQSTDPGEPR